MPDMTLYLKGSKDKELQPRLEGALSAFRPQAATVVCASFVAKFFRCFACAQHD